MIFQLRRLVVACVAAALSLTACAKPQSDSQARAEIQQVFDRYLQSVKTADLAVASTVWLQSPDIDVVTPLGRSHGWDGVQKELYVNFLQKMLTERDLRASNVHIRVNGTSAWLVFDWAFTGRMANGQMLNTKGRESHVYEKTAGGWRISHLHYSGLQPAAPQ